MTFQSHPKWKYSKNSALIVDDAEAEEALGEGWFDSPEDLNAHLRELARQIDNERLARRAVDMDDKALDNQIAKLQDPDYKEPANIDDLRKIAEERGLTYHPRLGVEKLEALIKADIEEKGE
ncbi:hypothetical protein D9M71_451960 [compost metagenome]